MKKFLSTKTEQVTIDSTGREISTITQHTHIINCGKEDQFYMVYFKHLASYFRINSVKELYLIAEMCSMAEYNTGKVSITTQDRQRICDLYNIIPSQYSRYIKDLIAKGLISGEKGAYYINPGIFWKGDRSSRFDLLKEGGLEFTLKFVIDGNGTKEAKPKADGIEDQLEPIEL